MFSSVKSVWGNKACQIFVTDFGDVKVYLLKNKGEAHMVVSQYFKGVAMYKSLHIDHAKYMDLINKQKKVLSKEGGIIQSVLNLTYPNRMAQTNKYIASRDRLSVE